LSALARVVFGFAVLSALWGVVGWNVCDHAARGRRQPTTRRSRRQRAARS